MGALLALNVHSNLPDGSRQYTDPSALAARISSFPSPVRSAQQRS